MSPRDAILGRIRAAVHRTPGQTLEAPPPVLLHLAASTREERLRDFRLRLEALSGQVEIVPDRPAALQLAARLMPGRTAAATDEPYLAELGIPSLPGVTAGLRDPAAWRALCATCDLGFTSARWALAATGTLVMTFDADAPRFASLLPPLHVAFVPASRLLADTQEWAARDAPDLHRHSSVVLITGPSRTADIEQILIRGVHGPKELLVVLVESD
jgi:L-lactate dehydrogenase complex protein LldG